MEATGKLLDVVATCVGGGSNAIGSFHDFIRDISVHLVGVEAGGEVSMAHVAVPFWLEVSQVCCTEFKHMSCKIVLVKLWRCTLSVPGWIILELGQSILGWAVYIAVMDKQPLRGFCLCTQLKGIIPVQHSLIIW